MKYCNVVLKPDEKAIFSLRELYLKYGYLHYKVGKFEEYDLYAGNKSFLVSDNILTFTDTNGKLMALKPDVTLSIVKNIGENDTSTHKYFYNENVYRTSTSSGGFREIMQTGLECIGNIDTYSSCEVLMLAAESLKLMSEDCLLVLSNMGYILGLFDACGFNSVQTKEALSYVESKNVQSMENMALSLGLNDDQKAALCFVTKFYGSLAEALYEIRKYIFNTRMEEAYLELCEISRVMSEYGLYLDFSVVNDMNYYDGIIFKGYINGISDFILSGGRYDKLVKKMGKRLGAIGFAVYLDLLERFGDDAERYDTDILLVYNEDSDISSLFKAVQSLAEEGKTVKVVNKNDGNVKYRTLASFSEGKVKILG